MVWIILIIAVFLIIACAKANDGRQNSIMEKLYATPEYERLWNLLEDCTLINADFPIMRFQIDQRDCTQGYFRFLIEFKDLGMCAISPQKYAIECMEQGIRSDFKSDLAGFRTNADMHLNTVIQRATDKAFRVRFKIQSDADDNFFSQLFDGRWFESRDFIIASPFGYYASSSGSCIVDTDCWQVKGDNAVYTGLLNFESHYSPVVPYAIENAARELFPDAKISRYNDGCYIGIPLRRKR